ncbi:MAG: hypothetical protein ACD_38C00013G0002 [uncultured bacterium]|nr:MAG: hypothetical protein ACD_38C00013G0002 [uncultured bacterium]
MSNLGQLKQTRINKLESLTKRGIDPYPGKVSRKHLIADARKHTGKHVEIAGRIVAWRGHGKLNFLDLADETGKIQIAFKTDLLNTEQLSLIELLDLGDLVAVQGQVNKTVAGEITVFVKNFQILTKTLRPLPDAWYGLKDVEDRYRQRYVDLLVNPEVKKIFTTRSKIVTFLRDYLTKDGFLEVETPILQPLYGGASAKPFTTRHNALDTQFYLRISDELYLKRLIVAGFEKVFEIGKDFRNEGLSKEHNPEFTMLEFYWAYQDYENLMVYTEQMLAALVKEIFGSCRFCFQGTNLDFTPPWPRKTYRQSLEEHIGIDINQANTEEKLLAEIRSRKIKIDLTGTIGYGAVLDRLYKQTTRPKLTGPLFLTQRPTAFVTLAKRLTTDPSKTASFQLLVGGRELINAYNELNDPTDQAKRWQESEELGKKGQTEHEVYDADYIRALEYGMPPTAGWGLGIDRLVAILTDKHSIKEVILFPTLKPEKYD